MDSSTAYSDRVIDITPVFSFTWEPFKIFYTNYILLMTSCVLPFSQGIHGTFRIVSGIAISHFIIKVSCNQNKKKVISFECYVTVEIWNQCINQYGHQLSFIFIWTASWQNKQSDCVPGKDPDQPGHLPSLIRVFAVRMKKAWVLSYPLSTQQRLWSDWVDAQTDLSLRWAHTFCWFCHVVAHF